MTSLYILEVLQMHTTINLAQKKKKNEWVGGVVEQGDLDTLTAGKTKHFFF